jgi:hypothetical protein
MMRLRFWRRSTARIAPAWATYREGDECRPDHIYCGPRIHGSICLRCGNVWRPDA